MILDKEDVKYIVIKLRKQVRRSTARILWRRTSEDVIFFEKMGKLSSLLTIEMKTEEILYSKMFPWIQYAVRNLCRPSYEIKD